MAKNVKDAIKVRAATYAGAVVGAAISVLCAIFVFGTPGYSMMATRSLFHMDWVLAPTAFSATALVAGVIVAAVVGAVTGYIIAVSYNYFAKD